MLNKKVKLIGSLLLGFFTIGGMLSYKTIAQTNEVSPSKDKDIKNHAAIKCYATGSMISAKEWKTVEELEAEKKQIESLYEQKKINKETYNIRLKKVKKDIKEMKAIEKYKNNAYSGGSDE